MGQLNDATTGRVAVVVVNYACAELVERNLGALPLGDRFAVVVVDNFAGPSARAAAAQLAETHEWQFVPLADNRGFGAGANAGIRAALASGCAGVILLNPDVEISVDAIEALADAVHERPDRVVSPIIRDAGGQVAFTGSLLDLRTGDTRGVRSTRPLHRAPGRWRRAPASHSPDVVPWLPATCLALPRPAVELVTGFDDTFFMYWEDVDLSARLSAAGIELAVLEGVEVVHDAGATQTRGIGGKSALYYRYACRNRLLYASGHLGRRRLLGWMLSTPTSSWEILLRGGGRRRLLRDRAGVAAAVRGSAEGLRVAFGALLRPAGNPHRRRAHRSAPVRAGGAAMTAQDTAAQDRAAFGQDAAAPVRLTVAMATYRRPKQAAETVQHLATQVGQLSAGPGGAVDAEVLVVDNDPDATARPVLGPLLGGRVRYVVEPAPGIAAVRNRALDESVARDLLVFIDDDEVPAAGWLAALVSTYRATGATAVSGPVESRFEQEPDAFVRAGGFFARRHREQVGTGDRIDQAATNNLLLDLAAIRRMNLRFDAAFGLSGGSDSLFTRMLTSRGGTIVWCRDAVVTEIVPAARLERRWLLTRAISYGTTDVRVAVRLANGLRERTAARLRAVLSGLLRVGYGGMRWAYGRLTGSVGHEALGLQTLLRGVGLAGGAFGYTYHRYRRPSSS